MLIAVILELPGDIYFVRNFSAFHIWRNLAQLHITLFQYTHIRNENTDEFKILRKGKLYEFRYISEHQFFDV